MGITNVMASANLSGAQYKSTGDAVAIFANLHFAPADLAAAANGVQNAGSVNDAVGAGINAAKSALALLEAIAAKTPYIGSILTLSSLGLNLDKLSTEWNSGAITAGTAAAVLGDIAAVGGIIAGLSIGGATGVAIGIALSGLSAGLTIASISPSIKDDPIWIQQRALTDAEILAINQFVNSHHLSLDYLTDNTFYIDIQCNRAYLTARNHLPRKDPLVLDLDGGGISTTPIDPNAPRLFDTDGDGVRTATGWVGAGEGIVVRDLNGNGTIDSGRELFGDATVLTQGPSAGQTAAHGFAALADLDSNADGQFDAADAAFASVRLWLDANQDGISQPAELHTLVEKGVARIEVAASVHNVDLGGGNVQTYSASFTRTSGQQGSAGTAPLAGSLLLAANGFYRQFSDDPATTPEAAALPAMHGSGWVRDLHPALSLGNGEAAALQAGLAAFAAAPTRAQQLALLDGVLAQWAASSGKLDSQRGAYSLVQEGGHYLSAGRDLGPNPIADLYVQTPGLSEAQRAALFQKLAVLEVFNGSRFFDITWDGSRFGGAGTGGGMAEGAWNRTRCTSNIRARKPRCGWTKDRLTFKARLAGWSARAGRQAASALPPASEVVQ